jgi:hypothetical protein
MKIPFCALLFLIASYSIAHANPGELKNLSPELQPLIDQLVYFNKTVENYTTFKDRTLNEPNPDRDQENLTCIIISLDSQANNFKNDYKRYLLKFDDPESKEGKGLKMIQGQYNDLVSKLVYKVCTTMDQQPKVPESKDRESENELQIMYCTQGLLPINASKLDQANEAYMKAVDQYKEVKQLEKGFQELHELAFFQYALVEEQGEQLERIQISVEKACLDVKDAHEDLVEAVKIKKRSIFKKFLSFFF